MAEAAAGNFVRAEDIFDTLDADDPITWTVTWTNLTKGTGPTEEGWYMKRGRKVSAMHTLTMGTSPSWSGSVSFPLPVECITGTLDAAVGSWVFRDNSALDFFAGTVTLLSSTTARLSGAWNGTAPVDFLGQGGTSPVALAVSDKVSVVLDYLSLS